MDESKSGRALNSAEKAERVRYVSRLSVDHYARLPGWFDAQDACVRRLGRLG